MQLDSSMVAQSSPGGAAPPGRGRPPGRPSSHAFEETPKPARGKLTKRGRVIELLPGAMYRVELENLTPVLAHVSARRNKDFLRLLPGDKVEVELSPRDLGRGRVIRRLQP